MSQEIKLNADQEAAFDIIKKFLKSAADTLVLRGYAGTGKTFLMQHLGAWLKQQDMKFAFLASTGRAASVLRGKTGFEAMTVHSELYSFSQVSGLGDAPAESALEKFGQLLLEFFLRPPDAEPCIYIIDESSMLASEPFESEQSLRFGSGLLMDDFFNAVGSNKVIFVGDPCQLPPVGQLFSPALDLGWLASHGRTAIAVMLNKIERQGEGSDILKLSTSIRELHEVDKHPRFPKMQARGYEQIVIHPTEKELFEAYRRTFAGQGHHGALAVARTNKLVGYINRAMRRDLYGALDLPLQLQDILLVVQNNMATGLVNGDFVQVLSIGELSMRAGLEFVEVRIKALASDKEYDVLLSVNILMGPHNNLSDDQQKNLMIDFARRSSDKSVPPNSDVFKQRMMKDKYLNCLRAKYGYGVTCHKAQGGEWDEVFLFLDPKMYGMPQSELFRWWYTAVTRAKKRLHLSSGWWLE